MVRHVALQWRHGNVALLDRLIVRAVSRVLIEILFANPEVRLAARIDVFGDHRPRILNSLPRDAHAFDFALREIDIQQRAFGQTFAQNFAHRGDGKLRRLAKSKFSRATRLNARPGTPRIVASSAPATVPE